MWRNIWFETLKAIHSRKANQYGFSLLTSILRVRILQFTLKYDIFVCSDLEIKPSLLAIILGVVCGVDLLCYLYRAAFPPD